MEKKIVVFGAGLVGNAIAIDLNKNHQVTSVDINPKSLEILKTRHNINTLTADLSKKEVIQDIVKDFDLVIGAVPGFMGYSMLKSVIEAGKNIVDISFFPENSLELDNLAKKHGVVAVTDCGVAPGMANILLGYHNERMNVEKYICYVGGLPLIREWPYEYKAVFSPIDVIEEYIRPARYVQHSHTIIKDALSDPEFLNFEKVGTLEAFNTDGLRSLIDTMKIPNMIEKTLRYPGCIEYIRVLRESGFFSYDEIDVKGKKIRPIDVTAKLLFPKWKLKPGEGDFTIMKVIIKGQENQQEKTYIYDLYDEYNKETDTISMARTTGYTCSAVANLVLEGKYNRVGISPPEYIGIEEENYRYILKYLNDRKINYVTSSK
jgi:saccharopine dehydrogenase-like NADP-dependent oxidoreductase